MSVNYTPSFENYTGQGKFRFWCQTVLPLIYDDSLSYMELLNKMVIYLNNTIQDIAAMETNVDGLLTAYNNLQNYINNFFDNLDVQEEINAKLDAMVEDGTFLELLQPFCESFDIKANIILVSQEEFENALSDNSYEGYICGEIEIETPVELSTQRLGNKKRFSNGRFVLNSNLFTSNSAGSVREIPSFTNCAFIGNGHSICDDGFYSQYGIFVNCIFVNCAFVNNGKTIQSAQFIGCKIINTSVDFMTTGNIIDTRFDHVLIDNDNTRAFLKVGPEYYPVGIGESTVRIASNISFNNCMIEGQSVTPIEVHDCDISFTDLYTEVLKQGLIKVNDSTYPLDSNEETNGILKLRFYGCRLQADDGDVPDPDSDYVVFINSTDYDTSRNASITVNSCTIRKSDFINKNTFRIYDIQNMSAYDNGKFLPSKELARIVKFSGHTQNSVVSFESRSSGSGTTYHAIVKKFPCLFSIKFQFSTPTRVKTLLFFVDKTLTYLQCNCLNGDEGLTYTATVDNNGYVDVEFEKNWYQASNGFGLYLLGQENIFSTENYYRSTFESGYAISDT